MWINDRLESRDNMNGMEIHEHTILIVMNEDKKHLIKYFSENDLSCPKMFTITEFIDKYYFSYDERAIYYLKEKYHYNYDVALMYLSLFYFVSDDIDIDVEKVRWVKKLKKELQEEGLLFSSSYFLEYLVNKDIVFYDVFFDGKATKLFYDLEKKFQVRTYFSQKKQYDRDILYEFSDISDEVVYVATAILEKIKSGISPSCIKLCGVEGEYLPVVKRIFSWFSLPVDVSDNFLYATLMGQDFLKNLGHRPDEAIDYLKAHYSLSQKEEATIFNQICDIVNHYVWVDDFFKIKDFLVYDFKHTKVINKKSTNGIEIIPNLRNVGDEFHVFLLGFNQGIIPRLKKDEDYFDDVLKEKLGLISSKEENKREKNRWLQEILGVKNLVITMKRKSPLGEFYPSSLNDDLQMRVENVKNTYCYSHLYNKLLLGEKLDTLVKYNEKEEDLDYLYERYPDIPYLSYDSSFKGISKDKLRDYLDGKLTLSYSAMNSYYQCGFRYYLSNVLKLNLFPNTFYTVLGNIYHDVLSKYKKEGFNFSDVYDEVVKKYEEVYSYDDRERFFIDYLKGELKFIIDTILKQEEESDLKSAFFEERIVKNYHYSSYDVCFKGFVDKMMVSDDERLVSIIDYKTGNPNLNLNHTIYGLDLQLPIYLFLARNKFPEARIVGFYLQKILNNEISRDNQHSYLELKREKLKLQGYSNSDVSILSLFDKTYCDSKVIKGMRTTAKGLGTKKVLDDVKMEALGNLAEDKITDAMRGIINANFMINPKRIGNDNVGCQYCHYRDICFMSEKDIVDLKEYKNLEFLEEESVD